ncbi:MAG: PspC domain-containing protein [Flavobacteriales bacterium]|nr:PspC domain-containing protein [Flavobacteriales bacterium]
MIDKQAFGVCSNVAEFLNMKASSVRLFFIYSSFLTLGSPLLVYLIMAFVFRLKVLVNSKRSSVFDF